MILGDFNINDFVELQVLTNYQQLVTEWFFR